MKYTFKSDDCMVITIPLGCIKDGQEGQLMPENFTCVFKDVYKVFLKGRPKELGAAQLIIGVFIICLGILLAKTNPMILIYIMPSFLFVASGLLSYAAGRSPDMCVAKLSFSFNIISFFSAAVGLTLSILKSIFASQFDTEDNVGLYTVVGFLFVLELVLAVVLMYWESKAVCRSHFNILPTVTLKQEV